MEGASERIKVDIRVPVGVPMPVLVESARICDAFELFGERPIRAWGEAGVERVFLFPAHNLKTGYQLPEVEAFGRVIGPRLAE